MTRKFKLWAVAITLAGGACFSHPVRADIVGGEDVDPKDPISHSTVALYRQTSNGGTLCTATLIGKDVALTAAHCVEQGIDRMVVIFGEDIGDAESRQSVRVAGAEIVRERNERHRSNQDLGDIALVRLEGKLPRGFHKAPLLPVSAKLEKGDQVLLAGYGISNAFKHTGAGKLRSATVTVVRPEFGDTEILLEQNKGSGACHGDSGGPAFVERNGKFYLMGVTSRGYPETAPDDCRHQVIYTRVNAYRDWISETVRANSAH